MQEEEEVERVPADPPATGQRADHEVSAPETDLPGSPERKPAELDDEEGDESKDDGE